MSPHPEPPSHLPPHPLPLGCPTAPVLSGPDSWIELALVVFVPQGNIYISMLFSQIIPPSPSPASYIYEVLHIFKLVRDCHALLQGISQPRDRIHSSFICSLHLCLFCCLAYRVVVTVVVLFLRQNVFWDNFYNEMKCVPKFHDYFSISDRNEKWLEWLV